MLYILQIQPSNMCPDKRIFPCSEATMMTLQRWDVPPLGDSLGNDSSVMPQFWDFPRSVAEFADGYAPLGESHLYTPR